MQPVSYITSFIVLVTGDGGVKVPELLHFCVSKVQVTYDTLINRLSKLYQFPKLKMYSSPQKYKKK
jgi:hypothetical protein